MFYSLRILYSWYMKIKNYRLVEAWYKCRKQTVFVHTWALRTYVIEQKPTAGCTDIHTWVKLNTFRTCRPSSVCACWNAMTVWFPSEFVDVCVIDVTVPVTLAPPNSLLLALPGEGELNLSAADGPGGDCRISVITINK